MLNQVTASVQENNTSALPAETRMHFAFLDGLRALAALYVFLYHLWVSQFSLLSKGWPTGWIAYGHLAVDVFIVLSGFCLMLPVVRGKELKGGAGRFFYRRARRILPPFYACLALCIPINILVGRMGHHHQPVISVKSLLVNLLLLQDVFPRLNILDGPLWSVAAEWKIYFLFPMMVWLWRRSGPVAVLAFGAVVGYGIAGGLHQTSPDLMIQHLCPWYVFLFAMGVCAAPLALKPLGDRLSLSWIWITAAFGALLAGLLMLFPITSEGEGHFFTPHLTTIDAVMGALTASALIVLMQDAQRKGPTLFLKVLSWRPLVFLGTFAYSLYLMHTPFLAVLIPLLNRMEGVSIAPVSKILILGVVGIPLIIGLSYAFFLIFERPFLSSRPLKFRSSAGIIIETSSTAS